MQENTESIKIGPIILTPLRNILNNLIISFGSSEFIHNAEAKKIRLGGLLRDAFSDLEDYIFNYHTDINNRAYNKSSLFALTCSEIASNLGFALNDLKIDQYELDNDLRDKAIKATNVTFGDYPENYDEYIEENPGLTLVMWFNIDRIDLIYEPTQGIKKIWKKHNVKNLSIDCDIRFYLNEEKNEWHLVVNKESINIKTKETNIFKDRCVFPIDSTIKELFDLFDIGIKKWLNYRRNSIKNTNIIINSESSDW